MSRLIPYFTLRLASFSDYSSSLSASYCLIWSLSVRMAYVTILTTARPSI
jgi:hypothetical protein